MWRLNNIVLKNQEVKEEIKEKVRKNLKTNENGNTTFQYPWDAAKPVLRGKVIVIQPTLRNKQSKISNSLTFHLKELEKEQKKPKVIRKKEIIKIREEINEIQTKK